MADEEGIRQGPQRTHSALSLPGEYVAPSIFVYETDPLAHEPTAHFRSKKTNVVGEEGEKIPAKRGGRRKIAPKGGGGGRGRKLFLSSSSSSSSSSSLRQNGSFLPSPLVCGGAAARDGGESFAKRREFRQKFPLPLPSESKLDRNALFKRDSCGGNFSVFEALDFEGRGWSRKWRNNVELRT